MFRFGTTMTRTTKHSQSVLKAVNHRNALTRHGFKECIILSTLSETMPSTLGHVSQCLAVMVACFALMVVPSATPNVMIKNSSMSLCGIEGLCKELTNFSLDSLIL